VFPPSKPEVALFARMETNQPEQTEIYRCLSGIVHTLTSNAHLRDDLLQEALLHVHRFREDFPDQTLSWYLRRCRLKLLDFLGQGSSVDSLKRQRLACQIP
jgi:DNA-directed RNA polymerase specialized sigma24 family protein